MGEGGGVRGVGDGGGEREGAVEGGEEVVEGLGGLLAGPSDFCYSCLPTIKSFFNQI